MKLSKDELETMQNFLKSKPNILACYFYGSRAKDQDLQSSDLDLVIVVDKVQKQEYEDIYLKLQTYFKDVEVDLRLVTSKDTGIFLFQVLKYGQCLYERDELEKVHFETRVLESFYDNQHLRDIYQNYTKQYFLNGNR